MSDHYIQIAMKLKNRYLALLFSLLTCAVLYPQPVSAQQDDVSFQVFYDALSPYGQWVTYQDYGYVWIPDVGPDFVPYSTAGYWVMTDYGWTWVSDYEWGWAPFHYGRWDYDNYYGWLWVPENEWGPSWVNWRRADGYYGWSPMEPGISLSVSFGRQYNSNNDHWMFVRDRDFERHDLNRYSVNRSDRASIIRSSTVINTTYIDNSRHTTYVAGPAREDVQRVTGRQIKPVSIRETNSPGQELSNGQLKIYRPEVVRNKNNERKSAPTRITNIKDVKQPSERNAATQPGNLNRENNFNREQQQQQRQQPQPQQQEQRPQQQQRQQPQQQEQRPQQQQQQQRQQPQQQEQRPQQQQQQQRQQPQQQEQRPQQQQPQQPQQQQRQQAQPQQQRQQQSNTARPQNERKEQPKESKPEQDRKKND
jgi:hypothetical protein